MPDVSQTLEPTLSFGATLDVLRAVLPGSKDLLPDSLADSAEADWFPFPVEDLDDTALGALLVDRYGWCLVGPLVVVTDATWWTRRAFVRDSTAFGRLVADHAVLCDDAFFAGDVLVVAPQSGHVVVVHHSGVVADLVGRPSADAFERAVTQDQGS